MDWAPENTAPAQNQACILGTVVLFAEKENAYVMDIWESTLNNHH